MGNGKFSAYYSGGNNPFNWIGIHPIRGPETRKKYGGDHAGKLETSEAMVICPELVEMDRLDETIWFSRPAKDASPEWGDGALEASSYDMEKILFR